MTSCEVGDAGEVILLAELVMKGMTVAVPWGHNNPFDLILITKDSKALKIQIKTSRGRGGTRFQFNRVKNFDKVDVFAFLLLDQWHFMTSAQVKRKVRPTGLIHLHKSKVKLNNFELLC